MDGEKDWLVGGFFVDRVGLSASLLDRAFITIQEVEIVPGLDGPKIL